MDSELLAEKVQLAAFQDMGNALNQLKNIDSAKARQIFADMDSELLAEKARYLSFRNIAHSLANLYYVNIEKTTDILENLDIEFLVSRAVQEKYSTFISSMPAIAKLSPTTSNELLMRLPDKFLFQFDQLSHLRLFNRLLTCFYLSDLEQHARRLIDFGVQNMETFMSYKVLKEIAYLLYNFSHYSDVRPIINKYRTKFYGKIKSGEPSEIPSFISSIYKHNSELALELLNYTTKHIDDQSVWGACYYAISYSLAKQNEFESAILNLTQAILIFENIEDKNWLCRSYFALAKTKLETENKHEARKWAEKAITMTEANSVIQIEIYEFLNEL